MTEKYIIGIDEVGRGPLAGPITLAALILPRSFRLSGIKFKIKDSKKLPEDKRKIVYARLRELKKENRINFSVSHIKHASIDKYGLTKCAKKGIARCLKKLSLEAGEVKILLDGGLKAPEEYKNQETIIKGDEKIKIIALASIIAKVCRDNQMCRLAKKFPEYGFEIHKGYGTKVHREALKKHGPCKIHRHTFLH